MPFDWLKSLRSPSRRNNSWGSITPLEPRTLLSATPIGPETQVNVSTNVSHSYSNVAMDADGDYVVTWMHDDGSANGFDIYARKFNSNGTPQGSEFRVNTFTSGSQAAPQVSLDADGDFVIAWHSPGQDGSGYGIYARRYDSAGTPQADEFLVNSTTSGGQRGASIDMDAAGNFIIAWFGSGPDSSSNGIYAQRFDLNGTNLGGEFQVNTFTTGSQSFPSIAVTPQGDFVIAWMSANQDGSSGGIYAQRFNTAGTPQGVEFQVNTTTLGNQADPKIAIDDAGKFVVTWSSNSQDGSEYGAFAQRFDASGASIDEEFQVNTYTSNHQTVPLIAIDASGDFAITWQSLDQDGSSYGVYVQRYDSNGLPVDDELRVNSTTTGPQYGPAVAMDADGDFVIVWGHATGGEFSKTNIITQRYRSPHPDQLAAWRSGKFYLDSNHSKTWNGSTTDTLNTFGSTTDKPLAGDWNGDAYADIAVWRNGTFYLDANGNGTWDGAATDKSFKFGLNTDTPIVGDWNGDGHDDIGVWRAGKFYLDLDGNRIWNSAVDKAFTFGSATDTPLIGDWNADGIDDLGVWRNGKFYLDLNANRAWNSGVDGIFAFGLNIDTPLIGDWNADGTDDIAVWRNGKFYQDSNGNRAWNSATDTLTTFGSNTDTPLIGYWRPKTIPGTPPNATPAPSPTPAAPLSIQVTPTAVTPFDFSGRWNYTGDIVNGFIRVNQTGKKASTLLRIGDLEFDMQAKIKADRLTGKFSKNLPDTKIRGKFEATRINSTTFSGLLTISTNNNPAELPILGTRV